MAFCQFFQSMLWEIVVVVLNGQGGGFIDVQGYQRQDFVFFELWRTVVIIGQFIDSSVGLFGRMSIL